METSNVGEPSSCSGRALLIRSVDCGNLVHRFVDARVVERPVIFPKGSAAFDLGKYAAAIVEHAVRAGFEVPMDAVMGGLFYPCDDGTVHTCVWWGAERAEEAMPLMIPTSSSSCLCKNAA